MFNRSGCRCRYRRTEGKWPSVSSQQMRQCLLQPAGGHIKTQQAIQWRRGRPQAWAWGVLAPLPPKKCYSVFCALVVTVKRSVIFTIFRRLLQGELCSQIPTGVPPLDPDGGLSSPDPLICPPLEKIPSGVTQKALESAPFISHYILSGV